MSQIYFSLDMSPESYLAYYRGRARNVVVVAEDGRRIAFPADRLRPFVTREGVRGRFLLEFDEQNRFKEMRRA